MTFPALTERRRVRFTALVALYVGQGVPQGLLVVALPAYLTQRGVAAEAVAGYLGLVLLPFALKVVAGPLLDRFARSAMGRRRPWVIVAGLGVVGSFAAMSLVPDAVTGLALVTASAVAANSFVAVLDVAVDGMAVDVLEVDEQPRANALMWGGATIGVALSAVGTSTMLDASGVGLASSVVAAALATLLLVPVLLRERPGERLFPWTSGEPSAVSLAVQPSGGGELADRLKRAMLLPSSLLLLAAAACAGALDGLVIAFMPVLAVAELGWSDTGYSSLVATAQVVSGLGGAVVGSVLIGRVGRVRMLVMLAGVVAFVLVTMAFAEGIWSARPTVIAFAFGYLGAFVLLTITLFATGMALCGPAVAATQFALFTAAMNVGRSAGSGSMGALDAALPPGAVFGVAAGLAVLALALASRIDIDAHRVRLGGPPHERAASAVEPRT